jgi:uncharacterized membrane protein HdeD (DUF308 family)
MVIDPRGMSEIGPRFQGQRGLGADVLLESLARNWWAVALRGVAAVIFGILTLLLPNISLATLVLLFGVYAVFEGVLNVVSALRRHAVPERTWWSLLLEGMISIAAGIVTFMYPGITAITLVYVIAAWAILTGVFEIVAAVRLRERIRGEGWLIAGGVLSVAFGALMMAFPRSGALAVVLWIGAYAVVFGGMLIALAFRLRRWNAEGRGRMARAA